MNKKKKYKKEYLFIAATHGNEGFSLPVLKKLKKEYPDKFDWVIGNPKALRRKVRFTETDLNRAAPGSLTLKKYESRRAAELIKLSRPYKYVIDIHGTVAKTGIFIIVTRKKSANIRLAKQLPIRRVVIWDSPSGGPISSALPRSLEIECGSKNNPRTRRDLYKILRRMLAGKQDAVMQTILEVYGKLRFGESNTIAVNKLREFRKTTVRGEYFYPLLINRYQGVICNKMRKVN